MVKRSVIYVVSMILVIVNLASAYFAFRFFYDQLSRHEWQVSSVFDTEPFPHIAYCEQRLKDEVRDDNYYDIAEPIDVVCTARKGCLVFTDLSNGKTYEGVYIRSKSIFNKYSSDYKIVFGELEGNIDFANGRRVANIVIDNKLITLCAIED